MHLAGPTRFHTGDAILLCRVYNGAEHIPSFLDHYRSLRVGHMIFLDNGSTDGSVQLLSGYQDVTVYGTSLPFKTHRLWMRRFLMNLCPPESWTLNVDIDELFDYPLSDRCDVRRLIAYLDAHQCNAMRGHMLAFFADLPFVRDHDPSGTLEEAFPWYDLSGVKPLGHPIFGSALPAWKGGVRSTVFGSDHFWLTKHPLIKARNGIAAFIENEHSVAGERLADVTGVLRHYKFTAGFPVQVKEAVEDGRHWNDSTEYRLYQKVLHEQPHLSAKGDKSQRWESADKLREQGFLSASDRFLSWASAQGRS